MKAVRNTVLGLLLGAVAALAGWWLHQNMAAGGGGGTGLDGKPAPELVLTMRPSTFWPALLCSRQRCTSLLAMQK